MCTPVYLKMNAHDPLLLSEGVCHQLGILKYHPDVKPREEMPGLEDSKPDSATEVPVPMVCVQLVKSTKVLPQQSTAVSVKLHGCWSSTGLGVLEADLQLGISGLCMEPSLMEVVPQIRAGQSPQIRAGQLEKRKGLLVISGCYIPTREEERISGTSHGQLRTLFTGDG